MARCGRVRVWVRACVWVGKQLETLYLSPTPTHACPRLQVKALAIHEQLGGFDTPDAAAAHAALAQYLRKLGV